jgi:gas vesicle protein
MTKGELRMHNFSKLKAIGCIAGFRGTRTGRSLVNHALYEARIYTITAPEPEVWETIRLSLADCLRSIQFVVRDWKNLVIEDLSDFRSNGFMVTRVVKSKSVINRTPMLRVSPMVGATSPYHLTFEEGMPPGPIGGVESCQRGEVKDKFKRLFISNRDSETMTGTAVGKLLRQVVDHLGAYRMGGQNYWIPPDKMDIWERVSKELRHHVNVRCYKLDSTSPETLSSIREAVMEDINKRVEEIKEDIASGSLSKIALETRKTRAKDLQAEITKLEEHFGETLDFVRSKVSVANQGLASSQSMMDDDDIFKVDL